MDVLIEAKTSPIQFRNSESKKLASVVAARTESRQPSRRESLTATLQHGHMWALLDVQIYEAFLQHVRVHILRYLVTSSLGSEEDRPGRSPTGLLLNVSVSPHSEIA